MSLVTWIQISNVTSHLTANLQCHLNKHKISFPVDCSNWRLLLLRIFFFISLLHLCVEKTCLLKPEFQLMGCDLCANSARSCFAFVTILKRVATQHNPCDLLWNCNVFLEMLNYYFWMLPLVEQLGLLFFQTVICLKETMVAKGPQNGFKCNLQLPVTTNIKSRTLFYTAVIS